MEKVQILAVAANKKILEVILRLINANLEWAAIGAKNEEEALTLFKQKTFDLVLFGAGIPNEKELKAKLQSINNEVICVDHYGGGSGLLSCEIIQGLAKKENI